MSLGGRQRLLRDADASGFPWDAAVNNTSHTPSTALHQMPITTNNNVLLGPSVETHRAERIFWYPMITHVKIC